MRPADEVKNVVALAESGKTPLTISRETGIPRSTVRDWLAGRLPNGRAVGEVACVRCGAPEHRFDELPPAYVYLLGIYLGDGCISAHARRVYRLRLFFDARYPEILAAGEAAVRNVLPDNRINRLLRSGGYDNSSPRSNVELSVYSRKLPCLFPQHGPGRKHERPIVLEDWRRLVEKYPEQLLRGLIHSDGCRFVNTGRNWRHPRYSFSNRSDDIRAIFCDACDLLGVRWTTAPRTVYVSRVRDVAVLDEFIGPKA